MSDHRVLFGSVLDIDGHRTGFDHPERPGRLKAVISGIEQAGLSEAMGTLISEPANRAALTRVHDESYLDALERMCLAGGGELDPDTPTAPGSFDTATHAAGLGLAAVAALRRREADAAFVAPRPPGHHATRARGMGFCLLNNVAITAAAITAAGERVAILDWDVHHGNGTQDIFYDDPNVLYASLHEWPAYPGSGQASEVGGCGAFGSTVNVPLPAGSTGDVAMLAMDSVIGPAIDHFRPDWLLISAGFDAHHADPLAGLEWSAGDYGRLTRLALELVPRARTVAFLEGGYDLDALARSAGATVAALADSDHVTEAPTHGGPGRDQVFAAARFRNRTLGGER